MPGLLGLYPSRKFKIYREEHPAIFRFNGKLFVEGSDENGDFWIEINEEEAARRLASK